MHDPITAQVGGSTAWMVALVIIWGLLLVCTVVCRVGTKKIICTPRLLHAQQAQLTPAKIQITATTSAVERGPPLRHTPAHRLILAIYAPHRVAACSQSPDNFVALKIM